MNINKIANETLSEIRNMKGFPFKTGHLKWDATYLRMTGNGFEIVFDGNIAPYIDYLEYGTGKHLIPNAFGRGITVLHPGSTKHIGFIGNKAVLVTIDYLCKTLNGKQVK